jgi:protein TonB
MGQPARLPIEPGPPPVAYPRAISGDRSDFAFRSLVLTRPRSLAAARGATLAVSIVAHAVLIAAVVIAPLLLFEEVLPTADMAVRTFFAAPATLAPAPPPPPPPPPAARARAAPAVAPPPSEPAKFVAPVEIPQGIAVEESLDLGVEGGVPGGVEGGVPGGVVGGIIGGLPQAVTAPPRPLVRIGGKIRAPKLVHEVKPEYPPLAVQARVQALIILEARVGIDGAVQSVRILRGHPLLDPAAIEAVKQWRYQPLLLNGVPNEFILNVVMNFQIQSVEPGVLK